MISKRGPLRRGHWPVAAGEAENWVRSSTGSTPLPVRYRYVPVRTGTVLSTGRLLVPVVAGVYWMNIQYFNYTVIIVMRIYFWISRLNKYHLVNIFEKNTIMWWVLETDRILNMNCQVTTSLQTRFDHRDFAKSYEFANSVPTLQSRTSLQTRSDIYRLAVFSTVGIVTV